MYKNSSYNIIVPEDDTYLLFNTLRGSFAKIDEECKKDLLTHNRNSKYVEIFLEQGFWIPLETNEIDEIKYNNGKHKYQQDKLDITLRLTEDCNLRCSYCYQEHKKGTLDSEKLKIIKKYIINKVSKGIKQVHIGLFGGEPLLNISVALELKHFFKEHSIAHSFGITTNGYLLTPPIIEQLRSIGVKNIQITLDGPKHTHDKTRFLTNGEGTYDVILNNLLSLYNLTNMNIIIRYNITKVNAPFIEELLEELDKVGLIRSKRVEVNLQETIKHETTEESLYDNDIYLKSRADFAKYKIRTQEIMLTRYNKKVPTISSSYTSCPFDKMHNYVIGTDLNLEYCTTTDKPIAYLDINGNEIENSLNYKRIAREPFTKDHCVKCTFLPLCIGGCAMLEYLGEDCCLPEKYVFGDYLRLLAKSHKILGN